MPCNSKYCSTFTGATGLSSKWFYAISAFLSEALEPLAAIERVDAGNFFGASISVSDRLPNYGRLRDLVAQMTVELQLSNGGGAAYRAAAIAAYPGFVVIEHAVAGEAAMLMRDRGDLMEVPDFVEAEFTAVVVRAVGDMYAGRYPPGYHMLQYALLSGADAAAGSLLDYLRPLEYVRPQILVFNGHLRGLAAAAGYTRDAAAEPVAQSTCRVPVANPLAGDLRVQLAQTSLRSAAPSSAQDFYNSIRKYPFRTPANAALFAGQIGSQSIVGVQSTCTPIVDSNHDVVACSEPPPPTNWWAVVLSFLLIALVVVAWAFGCIFAKRYDNYVKVEDEERNLLQDGSDLS